MNMAQVGWWGSPMIWQKSEARAQRILTCQRVLSLYISSSPSSLAYTGMLVSH